MYGRKAQIEKNKDPKEKEETKEMVDEIQLTRLESHIKYSGDFFMNNAKFFLINFEKMLVVSECNRINVMTSRELAIIDILTGHTHPIK